MNSNLKILVDLISSIYNLNYISWPLSKFNILIFIRQVVGGRIRKTKLEGWFKNFAKSFQPC